MPATDSDLFRDNPTPPASFVARLRFYGNRHGYVYAALSFIGRHFMRFWCAVAPLFARSKVSTWLAQPGPRILNLGGGSNIFDRWLTADVDPRADVFMDVTKPLLLPDGCVDVVYLEEVIEHVSPTEGQRLMKECCRILKPGGALRLTTPCLDSYCSELDASIALEQKINDIFYLHGHRHIYSKAGIRELLEKAGFISLTQSAFRDPVSPYGHFDTHAIRFAISNPAMTQYWDARKSDPDLQG